MRLLQVSECRKSSSRWWTPVVLALGLGAAVAADSPWFVIRVVDEATGRGVPQVELETVNALRFVTDNAGRVAFHEPGLMGQRVFFQVRSHGYEFRKDGFGYAGVAVEPRAGGSVELQLQRRNLAERLYRVTGEGLYRDTVLAGQPVPVREPLLNAQVVGQDSVQAAIYRGKIFWLWGDTARARYPLGHFETAGATSELPGHGGLDPSIGVNLSYFTAADGFSRPMWALPEKGLVWTDGLLAVKDAAGRERLVAHYSRRQSLAEQLEHGLGLFDDDTARFEKAVQLDAENTWRHPRDHPLRIQEGPAEYFCFPAPFPTVRVAATLAAVTNSASYEAFTCERAPRSRPVAVAELDRDDAGQLRWAWRRDATPMSQPRERELMRAGKLKLDEARFQLREAGTEKEVVIHGGSVAWNEFRRRWILIGVQTGGTSFLGEVWYAEADAPTGPWRWARKIVTHEKYSFYNPVHHSFLDQEGGRLIYFEGTYAHTFSGNPHPTQRYDYNQIMYRLDLADERLRLPPH